MTAAAWTMLAITWAVITFYTIKYFWMVVKTPPRSDQD